MKKTINQPAAVAHIDAPAPVVTTKKVVFILSQPNGNRVSFELTAEVDHLTQDQLVGTYMFPALFRLVKGSTGMFDKNLPVTLNLEVSVNQDKVFAKAMANVTLKSKSAHAVRRACLTMNEAIAGLVVGDRISIYAIADKKGERGKEFRDYSKALLRPSVQFSKVLDREVPTQSAS